jgi:macrolide-specific efflux system membrane fusion protein
MPLLSLAMLTLAASSAEADEPIRVESVFLELVEQSDVPARDPGVIENVAIREGDLVEKGSVLVQLDTAEAALDVERAQVELDIARQEAKNEVDVRFARKSLAVAEAELQRAQDSVKDYPKSVSETELDRLKLTVERTRLEIEQAEHVLTVAEMTADLKENALETAKTKLQRQTIRAPIDGVVVQIYRHRGEWLEPGQQVVRILRMDRLRARGFVSLAQVERIAVGAPVELAVDRGEGEAETVSGEVVHVSPEVDPVNHQVCVWAEVENTAMALKPGMRATMVIRPRAEETPTEPEEASSPGSETPEE